jgi:hypothetical protein
MRQLTNMLSPSPKGFQSPKFSDSDFREVRGTSEKSAGLQRSPRDFREVRGTLEKSADSDLDVRKALSIEGCFLFQRSGGGIPNIDEEE